MFQETSAIATEDMQANGVHLAANAVRKELVEPVNRMKVGMEVHRRSHDGFNAMVSSQLLKLGPISSRILWHQAGLVWKVWFVEAQQSTSSWGQALSLRFWDRAMAPNHGDEIYVRRLPCQKIRLTFQVVVPGATPGNDPGDSSEGLCSQQPILDGNTAL